MIALLFGLVAPVAPARADDTLALPGKAHLAEQVRIRPSGWHELSSRHLLIHYPVAEQASAEYLAQNGDAQVDKLLEELEVELERPMVVRLAGDRETFAKVQPGRPPEWASGTAYPDLGLMVLMTRNGLPLAQAGTFETTFVHESVHLLVGRLFLDNPIPRWLNEGLARFLANEASAEEWMVLSRAVFFGALIPFVELENRFPISGERAELAYAQSRNFLSYLTQRQPGVLPDLLKRLSLGASLNDALWAEMQVGLVVLEEDWVKQLENSYAWLSALTGGLSLWGVGAVLLLLAFLRKRRISQEKRARWEVEEAMLYGPQGEDGQAGAVRGHLRLIPGGVPARSAEGLQASPDGPDGANVIDSEPRDTAWDASRRSAEEDEVDDEDDLDDELMDDDLPAEPEAEEEDPEDRPPPGGWLH